MPSFRVKSSDGEQEFTAKPGTVINTMDGTTEYFETFAITGMVTILSSDGVLQALAGTGDVIDAVNRSERVDIDAEDYNPLPGIQKIAHQHEMRLRAKEASSATVSSSGMSTFRVAQEEALARVRADPTNPPVILPPSPHSNSSPHHSNPNTIPLQPPPLPDSDSSQADIAAENMARVHQEIADTEAAREIASQDSSPC